MFWFLVVFLFGVWYGLVLGVCGRWLSGVVSVGFWRLGVVVYGLMGFSVDCIWLRCGSSHSGSVSVFPKCAGGSSMVKPGPLVAISRRTLEGSRK